jgi:hypothetical protein
LREREKTWKKGNAEESAHMELQRDEEKAGKFKRRRGERRPQTKLLEKVCRVIQK